MLSSDLNPQQRFRRIVSQVTRQDTVFIETEDMPDLPSGVRTAIAHRWKLRPKIHSVAIQPIRPEQATDDLAQLGKWAAAFPGCKWSARTGAVSGIVVLESTEIGVETVRMLGEPGYLETLQARRGNCRIAFFRYPDGMRPRRMGRVLLASGIVVHVDGGEVSLPDDVHGNWPDLDRPVLDPPGWLVSCVFDPINERPRSSEAEIAPFEVMGSKAKDQ